MNDMENPPQGTNPPRRAHAHAPPPSSKSHAHPRKGFREDAPTVKMIPNRYSRKEDERGPYLSCVEAPNLAVRIDRSLAIPFASAKKYPKRSIFLDGAAQGKPYMDVQHQIYNLDHHEDCVRAFTLSTCEQVMVLLMKGMDLNVGDWTIYASEPDLDTVLAIWLLLNHTRLTGENAVVRSRVMPLVRLQGIIDAHGLEFKSFSAFPDRLQMLTLAQIERLRAAELELKKAGRWASMDPLEFVGSALLEMDHMTYSSRDFEDLDAVEELARISVGDDRVAVVCSSELGIYEVEEHLRKTHGNRLGLVVLKKDEETYTVRQVDPFLPTSLNALYERLNTMDPTVSKGQLWGGSADIGGSPRGVGTGLSWQEISSICRFVYQGGEETGGFRRFVAHIWVLLLALAGSMGVAYVAHVPFFGWVWGPQLNAASFVPAFHCLLGIWLVSHVAIHFKRARHSYGIRRPTSSAWALTLIPVILLSSASGVGSWPFGPPSPLAVKVMLAASCAAVFDLFFRSAAYALLLRHFCIMRCAGPWFLSKPNLIVAFLATATGAILFPPGPWFLSNQTWFFAIPIQATLLLASHLTLNAIRERTGSLLPSLLLSTLAAGVAVLSTLWLPA